VVSFNIKIDPLKRAHKVQILIWTEWVSNWYQGDRIKIKQHQLSISVQIRIRNRMIFLSP